MYCIMEVVSGRSSLWIERVYVFSNPQYEFLEKNVALPLVRGICCPSKKGLCGLLVAQRMLVEHGRRPLSWCSVEEAKLEMVGDQHMWTLLQVAIDLLVV